MKNFRLNELQIEYFRGATNSVAVTFDSAKPLVIVFGENGTGKSTLVDALDLIANGRIGSIEERSSATNKHAPAIGKKAGDVKVTLSRDQDTWKGTLKGTKPQVSSVSKLPAIDILRRSQLLRLVEAQPGKRYEALQHFIDVAGIESSENELDRAAKSANLEIDSANTRRLNAEEQLSKLWETNGKPGKSWQEWAKSKAGLSTGDLESEIASSISLIKACDSFISRKNDHNTAASKLSDAENVLNEVIKERDELQAAWNEQTPQLIETLTATSTLLDAGWEQDSCPVCQQTIPPTELRQRVSNALDAMKSLKSVHDREQSARRIVGTAQQVLAPERTKLLAAIRDLLQVFKASTTATVTQLELDFAQLEQLADPVDPTYSDWKTLLSNCDRLAALSATLVSIRDGQQRDKNQHHTIQTSVKTYDEAAKDIKTSHAIHQKLQDVLKLVRDLRIKFVQDILNAVSHEAGRLYQIIHPKEDTKSGRLELDPDKRASLLQFVEFAGHIDVEPQGYFSDSHLDTLGFCYWLALAKRTNPQEKIIVLDDVFTSVDTAHLGRIIELIDSECDHFAQLFIFTHNRNWRDRYRFNQAAGNKAHLLELHRWTPSRGVSHTRTNLELTDLVELLNKFTAGEPDVDRQELASRCGILLEAILSHLSQHYQCKVPHKPDGEYTLGDLISGCQTLMKVLHVQRVEEAQLKGKSTDGQPPEGIMDAFKKLCELAFIRNQVGCHFNLAGADIADSDVEQFGEATVFFARLLVCEHCGEVPRSDKSNFRQCSCKRTRLLPAKM